MKPNELIKIINNTFGFDIVEKNRESKRAYARFIYYNKMRKMNEFYSVAKIGEAVNRDHSSVVYGLLKYDVLINYHDFREMVLKVDRAIIKHLSFNANIIRSLNKSDFKIRRHNEAIHN